MVAPCGNVVREEKEGSHVPGAPAAEGGKGGEHGEEGTKAMPKGMVVPDEARWSNGASWVEREGDCVEDVEGVDGAVDEVGKAIGQRPRQHDGNRGNGKDVAEGGVGGEEGNRRKNRKEGR